MESQYFEFTPCSFDNADIHLSSCKFNETENDMSNSSSIEGSTVSYKYLIENDLL
jgi:hypothetical protein